jgi:hypothetical protein
LAGFGLPVWLVNAVVELYHDYRDAGPNGSAAQVSDAVQRLTGQTPRTLDLILQEYRAAQITGA